MVHHSMSCTQGHLSKASSAEALELDVASKVLVSACGRSLQVDGCHSSSLPVLQTTLQEDLGMEGQAFEFFDVHGTFLATDADLRDAVAMRRIPLTATLSDASIHYIENRREELSQMQWKLIRDQLSGMSEKILQLGRRMQEMDDMLTSLKKEQDGSRQRLRSEMCNLADAQKELGRQNCAQLAERIDSLTNNFHSDRNVREAIKQGLERQLQAVREQLEADRQTRKSENASTGSLIETSRQAVMEESRLREALEDRLLHDIHRLNDRMDALTKTGAEKSQDLGDQIVQCQMKATQDVQDQSRQIVKIRAGIETSHVEVATRVQKMEDRESVLESRLHDFMHRHCAQAEEMRLKLDKYCAAWEQFRLDERGKGLAAKNTLNRVDELEETIRAGDLGAAYLGAHGLASSQSTAASDGQRRHPVHEKTGPQVIESGGRSTRSISPDASYRSNCSAGAAHTS